MKKYIKISLLLLVILLLTIFTSNKPTLANTVPTDPKEFYNFLVNDPRLNIYSVIYDGPRDEIKWFYGGTKAPPTNITHPILGWQFTVELSSNVKLWTIIPNSHGVVSRSFAEDSTHIYTLFTMKHRGPNSFIELLAADFPEHATEIRQAMQLNNISISPIMTWQNPGTTTPAGSISANRVISGEVFFVLGDAIWSPWYGNTGTTVPAHN